ncbi:MAG TPA: hypothetical protein VGM59_14265 [Dongiaceae bacterium]|jgi:hypothetical protein
MEKKRPAATPKIRNVEAFHGALDELNKVQRATEGPARRKRDQLEGDTGHFGMPYEEHHNKGRPERTAKKPTERD